MTWNLDERMYVSPPSPAILHWRPTGSGVWIREVRGVTTLLRAVASASGLARRKAFAFSSVIAWPSSASTPERASASVRRGVSRVKPASRHSSRYVMVVQP